MILTGFLSTEQINELDRVVLTRTETFAANERACVILLLNKGRSYKEVGNLFKLDENTIREWFAKYQSGGLEELLEVKRGDGLILSDFCKIMRAVQST